MGGIFYQTQKTKLSHLRLFRKPESQLEVSVHNSSSLAKPERTGISEQTCFTLSGVSVQADHGR